MKLIILSLCIIFFVFCCLSERHLKQENSDEPTVENTIDKWVDTLNTRKFNRDNKPTSKVKKLFKEIVDYFKR